jgi:flagellar hook assembly protein FlgD
MSGLFGFLAFAALVAFVIGMIKPSLVVFWGKKKTRGPAFLYLVATIVFAAIAGGSSGNVTPSTPAESGAPATSVVSAASGVSAVASQAEQASAAPASSAVTESKPYTAQLSSGHYTAGIDFPAGTYTITAVKGNGNVSTSNMYSGGLNAVMGVKGDDMYQKEFKNAKIPEGEVLSISGLTVKISSNGNVDTQLKKRENTATKEVTFSAGNYVAGSDFPEGTYDIIAVKGSGNVSSDNMFDGGLNAIMSTKEDDMYIKEFKNAAFESGVTLTISGVTVKLVPSK